MLLFPTNRRVHTAASSQLSDSGKPSGVRSSPGPKFGVGCGVRLFGVAQGGLDVLVSEAFADGGQADAAVDKFGGVGVPELVQGRDHAGGGGIAGPVFLHGGVPQRPAYAILLRPEDWPVGVAGGLEVAAQLSDQPRLVEQHRAPPAALAGHANVFVVDGEVQVVDVKAERL